MNEEFKDIFILRLKSHYTKYTHLNISQWAPNFEQYLKSSIENNKLPKIIIDKLIRIDEDYIILKDNIQAYAIMLAYNAITTEEEKLTVPLSINTLNKSIELFDDDQEANLSIINQRNFAINGGFEDIHHCIDVIRYNKKSTPTTDILEDIKAFIQNFANADNHASKYDKISREIKIMLTKIHNQYDAEDEASEQQKLFLKQKQERVEQEQERIDKFYESIEESMSAEVPVIEVNGIILINYEDDYMNI